MSLPGATSGITIVSGVWKWVSGTRQNILDHLEWHDVQPQKIGAFAVNVSGSDFILLYRT